MKQTSSRSGGLFYGWIIVGVSTLALIVSNGLSIGGIPVFYKWIREDFVASGAVEAANAQSFIANGATLTFLVAGFFSPVAGYLIQKFSIRSLMVAGCFILGTGLILHSQATTTVIVYLARILMGASLGFVGVLANTVLVSKWFRRLRGTAIGIILTGTSLGGVLIPLIATPLITNYGWRTAMILVSLIVWVVLLPAIVFLVKNKPGDIGLFRDGKISDSKTENSDQSISDSGQAQSGLSLAQAVKTPIFWVFSLCAALIFYSIFVVSQQLNLYLQSSKVGFTPQQASFVQSLLFALSIAGKFLFGFLSDRFAATRVMFFSASTMCLSTLAFLDFNEGTVYIFVVLFGLNYGGTFVLLQLLVADYFGTREYGKILGVITLIETVGAAFGGIITGRLADAAGGDYAQAFYGVIITTAAALFLVVALNFMFRSPNRLKA